MIEPHPNYLTSQKNHKYVSSHLDSSVSFPDVLVPSTEPFLTLSTPPLSLLFLFLSPLQSLVSHCLNVIGQEISCNIYFYWRLANFIHLKLILRNFDEADMHIFTTQLPAPYFSPNMRKVILHFHEKKGFSCKTYATDNMNISSHQLNR